MATLEFSSYGELNATPHSIQDFAQALKGAFDLQSKHQEILGFMHHEVRVAGAPFSITSHMRDLERREMDLDEIGLHGVVELAKASKVFRAIDPGWKIADMLEDARIGRKLNELEALDTPEGQDSPKDLARRAVSALNPTPLGATVKMRLQA